jgi:outer membrane protein assembly factor BamA
MAPMLALAAALLLAQADAPAAEEAASRRYVVERIELRGLAATRQDAVRRHLAVSEGHVLDEEAVLVSRLRLLQLGWFSQVEVRVEKGSQRGMVALVFQLTERNTLIISDLVVGHTAPQPFYGGLGLSEQNFLGQGLGLSGAFVYGGAPLERAADPDRFSARAAFFAPDIPLGATLPRLVAGVSLVWLRGEELTCPDPSCRDYRPHYGDAPRLRYDRLGGEAVLGIRPGPFERLFAGFRMERVDGTFLAGTGPVGPAPVLASGRSLVTALTGTYDRDTRDDFFLPRDGTRFVAQVTFGSPALGGDYEYSRWLVQAETAFALPRGHALKLLGAAGATQGDAPFFERFYAADWAYFSVGPAVGRAMELNFSTDSRYDALLLTVGAEYAIPLWSSSGVLRRGYLALGARELYTAERARAGRTAQSSTPFSADVALRLDTPVGSFNLSLGYAVDLVR